MREVRLESIRCAITGLERAARLLSNQAKGCEQWDTVRELERTAAEAQREYGKLSQAWPRLMEAKEGADRDYDRYVSSRRFEDEGGCSCHLSAPCSYCTREADAEMEVQS